MLCVAAALRQDVAEGRVFVRKDIIAVICARIKEVKGFDC